MKENFAIYAIKAPSFDIARARVEKAFGFVFAERESLYQGGIYYRYHGDGEEQFLLKRNTDPFDDEPAEQEHPDVEFLLYVDHTLRTHEIRKIVEENKIGTHLRTKSLY